MSEKRKDDRGRLLRQGESQRKDGKYEFKYTDAKGERHSAYSWKLVDTDKVPDGKRCNKSLREMEKQIRRDLEDGVESFSAYRTSLNRFFDDYIETKYELKLSTKSNYIYMYDMHIRNTIGTQSIAKIKYSDIKKFYISLIRDKGFKPHSMEIIHTILHPVFNMAVRDNVIRINPTDGVMSEIKRSHDWETPKRHALTVEQQEAFMNYVASTRYKKWLTLFTVMLGTGGRVGEIVGLRWEDCDFEDGIININHSLIYRRYYNEKCTFHITTPKTKAGTRIIPMLSEVRHALLEERLRQMKHGFNKKVVDGYSGFIFANRFGETLSPHCVNRAIWRIIDDYNGSETKKAQHEHRDPLLLPHFSAHNLRHTFCTRYCEVERDLKVIQEVMGHADITTTMNIYNEATKDRKKTSFANLEGKIKVS